MAGAGAWVGFDLALLVAFAATGWAAWRRRQVLIICLVVLATLLCCDAWFDVVLDLRTSGFMAQLAVGAAGRAAPGRFGHASVPGGCCG